MCVLSHMFYVVFIVLLPSYTDHTVCMCVFSAGGGTAENQGSGEDSFSVTEESRGRMCSDGGERHQDRDAGQEREGVDSLCTQVHDHLIPATVSCFVVYLPWMFALRS